MLDRIKSFSNSSGSRPPTPQRDRVTVGSEASCTSGSESSSTNGPGGSSTGIMSKGGTTSSKAPSEGGGSRSVGGRSTISSTLQRGRDSMGACASSSAAIRLHTIADVRLRCAAERFVAFRSKLRVLDGALREHHASLIRSERSRSVLSKALADAGRGTPLHDLVGRIPDLTDERTTASSSENGNIESYCAIQVEVAAAKAPHLDSYREETLSYVTEWEKTISTRIATELRHVRRLHGNFVKYHRKVETLRNNAAKKKGGAPSDSELAKIERNESKLRTSNKEYRRNLVAVTLLTEEVTDRGWKDLVPLVLMLIEHDVEVSRKTGELIAAKLTDVREETKELGRRYEMDYAGMTTGRLRVLLEEDATEFVSPEDLADIESIQPSIGTASVGTGTFGRGASTRLGGSAIPPPIQENPTAEQMAEGAESAATPKLEGETIADVTLPRGNEADGDENDDPSSLNRPTPEGATSPKSPSAPPADLMSAVSRGADVAEREAEEQRRARAAAAAALPQALRGGDPNRLQPNPLPPGHPGMLVMSPNDADDEASKINYPSSIYFADANYSDDVTALTPYPDLVSI